MPSQTSPGMTGSGPAGAVRLLRWLLVLSTSLLVALPLTGAEAAPRRTSHVSLAAPRHVAAGSSAVLRGHVRPHARGRLVLVQRHTARGWRTVRRTRTNPRSRFAVRLPVGGRRRQAYRARVTATRRARPAASRRRTVSSRRAVSPSRTGSSQRVVSPERAPLAADTLLAESTWQPCGTAPLKADGTRWRCTFDDEFDTRTGDSSALDLTRWRPEVSTQNNFYTGDLETGVVCYTNDPDTIGVSGGALHLSVVPTGRPLPCGTHDGDYRGGMVHSFDRFSQTYGRFEVRARLPQTRQTGLQETLWLYPDKLTYGAWPGSGEIDFAEFYSQYPDLVVPYLHYAYDPGTTDPATGTNVATDYCAIDPTAWNTYTVVWEPGTITISRNGRTCLVDHYRSLASPPATAPFDQPFHLLLSQAVGYGSNAPTGQTPFPATMDVDYVRAWR